MNIAKSDAKTRRTLLPCIAALVALVSMQACGGVEVDVEDVDNFTPYTNTSTDAGTDTDTGPASYQDCMAIYDEDDRRCYTRRLLCHDDCVDQYKICLDAAWPFNEFCWGPESKCFNICEVGMGMCLSIALKNKKKCLANIKTNSI